MNRALLIGTVALAGCFTPAFDDGKTPCSTDSDCPPGLRCAADSTCWHDGANPTLDMSVSVAPPDLNTGSDDGGLDLLTADLTGVDLQRPVKHQGEQCSPSDTCAAGTQCVDGYCCDSTCTGACKACDVQGFLGICSPVASGSMPVGTSRSCNAQTASTCGHDGKCDGNGNCRNWPSGTTCASGTCTAGNFVNASTCDGAGNCTPGSSGSCSPYICQDATQCYASCTGNAQCSGTNTCVSMSCGKLANGQPCAGGNGALCTSGFCVDGYCCNTACNTAPCQACDVAGKQGTCSTVPGPTSLPHGTTRSCTNQGTTCGGYCNGATTACTYPSNAINCLTMCFSSTQLQKNYCDGTGSCAVGTPMTCANGFACEGSACVTTCGTAADCVPGFSCAPGGVCLKVCVFDQDNWDDGSVFQ